MKIAVLVKQVPDTWEERRLDLETGLLDREAGESVIDEVNERALEVALQLKDADKDTEIVVVSMGPDAAKQAIRKALSMGADSAVHIVDDELAGSDASRTAAVLAAALRGSGFDLILAGNESTDGRGGVIPAMVAEHLGLPALAYLNSVVISGDAVSGERTGADGTLTVHASLPAVVTVTEAAPEGRFPNFKGIMTAKKKPVDVRAIADLDIDEATAPLARTEMVSTAARPARTVGTIVTDEGNAGVELAEYLASRRLI